MNPLKIYNYVALHRPVVTTPVDNIDEGLALCLRFADDSDAFAASIQAALINPMTDLDGYEDAVRAISWEQRTKQLRKHIFNLSAVSCNATSVCLQLARPSLAPRRN